MKAKKREIDHFWISSCTRFAIKQLADDSCNVYIRKKDGTIEVKEGFDHWGSAHTFLHTNKEKLGIEGRLHHLSLKDFPIYFDKEIRKQFIEKNRLKEFHFDISITNLPGPHEFIIYAPSKREAFARVWEQLDAFDSENVTNIKITYIGPIV